MAQNPTNPRRGRKQSSEADGTHLDNLSLEMGNKPPQELDVEAAVIGAMLVEPSCVDDSLDELDPHCFYDPKYRMIFEAMSALGRKRASVDVLTVAQQLKMDGNLEAVGGPVALADLSRRIGAAAHVEFHIKILKQKKIQRELISASYGILKDSYDDSVDVDQLIDTAQSRIYDAVQDNNRKDVQDIGTVINKALEQIQKLQNSDEKYSGVPSGFKSLDDITLGFQPSDLIILAARPSVGKTAFVVNVARNAAVDYGVPVAFFSLEMPAVQLANRMMISETGLEAEKIKGGVKFLPHEWKQLEMKLQKLSKAQFYIDDTPSLPIMEFRSKVKRLVSQKKVGLVIVDYLQLMQGPSELRGMREQEVAAISRALKATAKELNIPIIALSQLSRQAVQRQNSNNRPQLSDLRESGSIEQDADMVLFIHRLDYQGLSENPEDKGKTQLIIAKHRNGQIGDIELVFRSSEVKFVDISDSLMSQAQGAAIASALNAPMPEDYPSSYGGGSADFDSAPDEFSM